MFPAGLLNSKSVLGQVSLGVQESLKIPIPLSGADELCHKKTFRADSRVISMTPRLRGKEERRREGSMEGGKKSESTAKLATFF